LAASGSITNPALTSAEVRNIRDLTGITRILRRPQVRAAESNAS
jgi:hypothetical protein